MRMMRALLYAVSIMLLMTYLTGCSAVVTSAMEHEEREEKEMEELPELSGFCPEEGELDGNQEFPGVMDCWPESISLEDGGMTAKPLCIDFEVEEAMHVSVSCMTTGGELQVKILSEDRQHIYFDEKNPQGDYEVSIDEAGICYLEIYAKDHRGSIRMTPVKK